MPFKERSDTMYLESAFSDAATVPFVWESKDIKVLSNFRIVCEEKVDPLIQQRPIDNIVDPNYEKHKPTNLQFLISSQIFSAADAVEPSLVDISLEIPYTNRLTATEARYAVICVYDGLSWIRLDTTCDEKNYVLRAATNRLGPVAVFLNEYWYSSYTQRTVGDEFPLWTFIRQSRESNGQRFMNFLAMQLEVAEDDITDIKTQKFLPLLNTKIIDWVYVYELPSIAPGDTTTFRSAGKDVPLLPDLRSFFYNKLGAGGVVDTKNRRMYSQYRFEPLEVTVNGSAFTAMPIPHHIWNPFDEFGLLAGVERLHLETNANYKDRILDAFRYQANSSDLGLTHAISREMNLIKRFTWNNDTKNLRIRGKGIDPRTLRLDGQKLAPQMYDLQPDGSIILFSMNSGVKHTVSFIQGIKKHELHDPDDEELHSIMYQPDGQATSTLENWVAYINQVAPIMWGKFNWDEGFWDTIDPSLTGLGYLPNMWDSDIEVWKNYMFDAKPSTIS
jgi:hypothetical protein